MQKQIIHLALFVILLSCSKRVETIINANTISNELWTYDLATGIPVEAGFSITEEPSNAIRSELNWDDDGVYKYFYRSEQGFVGQERITIQLATSPGDGNFSFTKLLSILTYSKAF
jgi:hypothetical protein